MRGPWHAKTTVSGSWVGIEAITKEIGTELVSLLVRFLIQHDHEIGGEHVIEGADFMIGMAFGVDVGVDPVLNVSRCQVPFSLTLALMTGDTVACDRSIHQVKDLRAPPNGTAVQLR